MTYIDANSPSVAFLVRAGGSASSPQPLQVTTRSGRFQVECLDALDGRRLSKAPGRPEGGPVSCLADAAFALSDGAQRGRLRPGLRGGQRDGRGELSVEEIHRPLQQYRAAQLKIQESVRSKCLLTMTLRGHGAGIGLRRVPAAARVHRSRRQA